LEPWPYSYLFWMPPPHTELELSKSQCLFPFPVIYEALLYALYFANCVTFTLLSFSFGSIGL
jgi:hypothetical protein